MPNQKAIAIAKKLGRPLPKSDQPAKTSNKKITTAPSIGTGTSRPTESNAAKSRPPFRPQAFKPSRGV